MSNLEDEDEDDPRSRVPGSAASLQIAVESQLQECATHEDEADLDLLAHGLNPEFDDSSGSEMLDDWDTEPDILVF